LHDTLEDTDTSVEELRKIFGELVTELVIQLTSDKKLIKIIRKTDYLSRKLVNSNKISSWTLVIKLADRLDNISDLSDCDKNFRDKYKKETFNVLRYLENNQELSKTHNALINEIKKRLERVK